MKMTFKNPFEVNENDTLGTAILKGAVEGYLKGTLAAAAGLGMLGLVVMTVTKKEDSKEEEEDINEQLEKNWEEIKEKSDKDKELVDSI